MVVIPNRIIELMECVNLQSVSVIMKGLVEKGIATVVAGVGEYVWRYS
jgi:hypothetical protein